MENLDEALREFGNAIGNLAKAIGKVIKELAKNLQLDFDIEFLLAYNWAKKEHPEWVTILNRTKKKRIRKKYQDWILREYKKRCEG